ncbi:MAG TPA: haloacid dehalogenase-like hydrolase, partial [Myxococcota bacterium]
QPSKPVVAVIFDFDDTLAPDSTSQLLAGLGVDVAEFWREDVAPLVRAGWDPVPAYLYALLAASRAGRFAQPLTRDRLDRAGRAIQRYPGVDTLFTRLRDEAAVDHPGVGIEFYVITSGLERLVAATRVGRELTQLWGCEFHYGNSGEALFPANLVSFTDKTRYLFQIEKGLIAPRTELDAFAVNHKVPEGRERVPFSRMIYVGDGYTDVPCFSLVGKRGGIPIAVVDHQRRERWGRAWGFIEEQRAMNLCLTDYAPGGATETILRMSLQRICESIERTGGA